MSDNLEHQIHGHYGKSQMVLTPDQQFSNLLSKSLDCIGYNEDMVKYRAAYWKLNADIWNSKDGQIHTMIAAGSQAEGVVKDRESDLDAMLVFNDVICTNNLLPFVVKKNTTIFQTVNHDIEPGYTKLKLVKIDPKFSQFLHNSMFLDKWGDNYVSSVFFTDECMKMCTEINRKSTTATLRKSGPALPLYFPKSQNIIHDLVLSFKCYCPELLHSWLFRPRRHNWPSRQVLYDISQMEAHVVPVGRKGSDTFYQEWRICFTKAEIHLIHSLNDTQIKLYTILKLITKHTLKPLCPEITSYIMKNIVFWMSEIMPSDLITMKQLGCRIVHALEFIKQCVIQNSLPSYMIPDRNLFNGKIDHAQRIRLIEHLTLLIEEGPSAVFKRIDRIRDAMLFIYRIPAMAEQYRIKRDIVEKLHLFREIRVRVLRKRDMSDQEFENVKERDELLLNISETVVNIILPDWEYLSRSGVDTDTIINDTIESILS